MEGVGAWLSGTAGMGEGWWGADATRSPPSLDEEGQLYQQIHASFIRG